MSWIVYTLLALSSFLLCLSFKRVPRGFDAALIRFGSFRCLLGPGCYFTIPLLERLRYASRSPSVFKTGPHALLMADGAVLLSLAVDYCVLCVDTCLARDDDYLEALEGELCSKVAATLSEIKYGELRDNLGIWERKVCELLSELRYDWGIELRSLKLSGIKFIP